MKLSKNVEAALNRLLEALWDEHKTLDAITINGKQLAFKQTNKYAR